MTHQAARQQSLSSIDHHWSLVPQELRTLANAHELGELHRYRQLAFAFLTFDTATSRLMAALGIECEMRLERLVSHSTGMQATSPYRFHQQMANNHDPLHHVFIDSTTKAREALNQAIADARASSHCYSMLSDNCGVAALYPLLKAIVRQKEAESQVLEEHRIRNDDAPS